ncbi:MAG: DEAD/DEAH box helicase [Phycisphaerales bacterium]|nr:MAG: DEAD/DEAH box helicase [Phycisphaerales bacterium]
MDRGEICDKFLDSLTFDLYPVQEEALLAWYESEGGVLVSAPTGMGKTLIAESAIFEALHAGQRLYYTTPLIALTDQKFRDFQRQAEEWGFAREDIGLITGNRRVNPDARVRIVVAEILLNHLLSSEENLDDVSGVVMDEFHYFNDWERGVVWELSLVLLPAHIRLMLLSATVGNAVDFARWAREEHGRKLQLVQSTERRVPLEFVWVGDKLLAEQLPAMVSADDAENRTPALVFCFNRDECWEVAERIKGVKLIDQATREQIEENLPADAFSDGIGPKLKQMLIRGVGVHHAGVLPKYKEIVEDLFLKKLIPFVICTETLAAGINLPARSVVVSTLLKGKLQEKKLVAPSSAHQMFGRAGRPQFDTQGYVFALAHEDDVKIDKWRKKYDQIDPNTKDPGLLRVRKQLERKKPSRRKTQQYWAEGQFQTLIKAGPGNLSSCSMIPYSVLIYLLTEGGSVADIRKFLSKRFNKPERLSKFQDQLEHMLNNLAAFGYLTKDEESEQITLDEKIHDLVTFRSVDPLYGAFCVKHLARSTFEEKVQALESVLPLSPGIDKQVRLPDLEPGPYQTNELEPTLLKLGVALPHPEGGIALPQDDTDEAVWDDRYEGPRKMTFAEMLKALFDAKLASPEIVPVHNRWVAGGIFEAQCDFYKFVRSRNLTKNEGIVLRHLLRLVILAGEFLALADEDPDYQLIGEQATRACMQVDPRYTDRFLAEENAKKAIPL